MDANATRPRREFYYLPMSDAMGVSAHHAVGATWVPNSQHNSTMYYTARTATNEPGVVATRGNTCLHDQIHACMRENQCRFFHSQPGMLMSGLPGTLPAMLGMVASVYRNDHRFAGRHALAFTTEDIARVDEMQLERATIFTENNSLTNAMAERRAKAGAWMRSQDTGPPAPVLRLPPRRPARLCD